MNGDTIVLEHPEGPLDVALVRVVEGAATVATLAANCADACLAEPTPRVDCVRKCLDTVDVAQFLVRTVTRRSTTDGATNQALNLARTVLFSCAVECEAHDDDHCRRCAEACRALYSEVTLALE